MLFNDDTEEASIQGNVFHKTLNTSVLTILCTLATQHPLPLGIPLPLHVGAPLSPRHALTSKTEDAAPTGWALTHSSSCF